MDAQPQRHFYTMKHCTVQLSNSHKTVGFEKPSKETLKIVVFLMVSPIGLVIAIDSILGLIKELYDLKKHAKFRIYRAN